MTAAFKVGITVRRPRPEVASVMFDVNYLPGWLSGVRDVEVGVGAPPKPGATVTIAGGHHADLYEVVAFQEDQSLALQSDMRTLTLSLEGVPVGTVAWLEIETERTGLRRILGRLIDYRARRTAIRDLRRLKRLIESGDYRTWWADADDETEGD